MTSLKSLAEHLGLSQATVSRALNNYSTVNAETRERVLRAAREMEYRPNASARRLATGKAGAYGMILTTEGTPMLDPQFSDFMAGLTEALAGKERDVVLGGSPNERSTATYERFIRACKVDGFVITRPLLGDSRAELLERLGVPFVLHGRTAPEPDHAYYDIDNFGAFQRATELLMQLGHRKIALLNGRVDAMFAIMRRDGFLAGVNGLARAQTPISETPMTEQEGFRCMRAALETGVTAAICSSIHLALGAERAIHDAGLALGRDMSLICHDDDLSGLSTVSFSAPLTVTRAPIRDAGRAIAGMLEQLCDGADRASQQIIAPVELILRASTRPPITP
ncbi:substrate-binding domain-containing protein [Aliiruegeria lutimaris]|uniref:LacI family transcriptional regulator n=1 Tax=Aliiruegeria lutimaris TaxID=571298 RepID=A0A1G8XQA3_9RHOB|nr:substrate-binding domain-containing protein [Aliiruegeria lutimaris]SDJ92842.1 LacI family transcriptional regulator [Aliiruegeria lutimaris]